MRKLLTELQVPQEMRLQREQTPPCRTITTQDHVKAFKKAKEKTAAGMSGLHFGMFKAHALNPRLATLDVSMRSVACATGHSCERWQRGLDVQLLKRAKC